MDTRDHDHRPQSLGGWSTPTILVAIALTAGISALASQLPAGPDRQVPQVLHLLVLALFTGLATWRALLVREWPWTLIAAFGGCAVLAQALWMRSGVLVAGQGGGAVADGIWLAGIVVGGVGIAAITFGRLGGARRWRSVSDGLVVAAVGLYVLWAFVFGPQLDGLPAALAADQYERLSFVAVEVVLVGVIALAAFHQRARPLLWWVLAAVSINALADCVMAWTSAHGSTRPGAISLAAWTMAVLLLCVAVVAPDGEARPGMSPISRRHIVNVALAVAVATTGVQIALHRGLGLTPLVLLFVIGVTVTVNQVWVNREISELTTATEAAMARMAAGERRFRTIFERAPVGMVITELDGRVVTANPPLVALLGVPVAELVGRHLPELVPDDFDPDHFDPGTAADGDRRDEGTIDRLLEEAIDASTVHRATLQRGDGARLVVDVSLSAFRTPDGEPRVIGVVEDVTERELAGQRLEYLATHDALTGLANRRRFTEHLEGLLVHGTAATRPVDGAADDEHGPGTPLSVAFVDLDRFKVINDSLGHEVGDELLLELGRRLAGAVGDRGLVARFGGDEFTLVLTTADGDELRQLVEEVRTRVAEPVDLPGGERFHPTISIGVTTARSGSTADRLISEADAAMYRAKARGRNRAEYYQASSRRRARVTLRLTDELHRALERGELEVHFQPIVEVATGVTIGHEALVRWRHPERGVLAPGHFLDVAEESGIIVEIGEWVLRTACERAAQWPLRPDGLPQTVSVNVAARQLTNRGLTTVVADALTTSGLDVDRLWLEVTETAVMTDPRTAGQTLGELRGLGLHLALDDFGTGYSSLTYLKRFPFETIKIDRGFVGGLGLDPDDTAIVGAVANLARSLGLFSVAEGVETPLQLAALRELGCDFAQGFLLGRPTAWPNTEQEADEPALPVQP